jgi:hypothetical protein
MDQGSNGGGYQGRGNGYQGHRGGYQGIGGFRGGYHGHYGRGGHGRGREYYYICLKDDHMSPNCPVKDRTKLKFCNICGVGDHSLEDYPIILDKIRKK